MATSATLPAPTSPMIDTRSMLAGLPADLMSGADSIPVPGGGDDAVGDDTPAIDAAPVVDDAPPSDETISDGRSEGAEDTSLDAQPPEGVNPPTDATPAEELPEGIIKTKDAKGRYKYSLDESRYTKIYSDYKTLQNLSDTIGEPATAEAIDLRNRAYHAQEHLFTNLTSGDPAAQAEVVDFFLNEMQAAHNDGETGVDPTVPFAETVYSTLRDRAPDAYAHLRMAAARDFIGEMFELAASTGDDALGASAGHIARALAGIGPKPADMNPEQYLQQVRDVTGRSQLPFYTPQEWRNLQRGEDPLSAAQQRIRQLETQVNGRSTNTAAEQFVNWDRAHAAQVNKSVFDDAVKPALASVEPAWKNFPNDYNDLVVNRLNSAVNREVLGDQALNQQVTLLRQQAQRATSEAVRARIGTDIRNLFVNRAKLATEKVKGPILKFAAEALAGRSAQTHDRRTAAQSRTAPQGQGSPVRHSVLPEKPEFKNGIFNAGDAVKQAMALVNGGR